MTTNPTAPSPPVEPTQGEIEATERVIEGEIEATERVIEFLSTCGDCDIEAGVGAIFGHGSDEKILRFKAGISDAITSRPAPSTALDPQTVEACAKELDARAYPHAAAAIRALIPKATK